MATQSNAPKNGLNALLTPEESVLVLIDHQPFQFANLHSHEPTPSPAADGKPATGNFAVFDELFADDFVDHTPQPGRTPDKAGARELYKVLRAAFPDFHAEIHWQLADGDRVTTYKTYHGTHLGEFFGVAPTGRKIQFETVDVMRVRDGQIAEHWGVANLFSLMQQLGAAPII